MIVAAQGADARIGGEIPKLDRKVRRAGGEVRSRRGEGDGIDRVGVSLESADVVPRFVIPNLDRPVLAAANRHGVDGMDRHARHLPLMALEGVDGGRTGDHPPAAGCTAFPAATTTNPGPSQPGPVGVDPGALRGRPLQLQHLLLQAGDGRPLLLEEGRRRRRCCWLAVLGLARAGIGLRQGRRGGGEGLPRPGEQILVDAPVEVGPLPIGQDHGGFGLAVGVRT
mmetsp:Transcript_24613/g.70977  ORF Transcript_24613/g.70977 Transcript_24613/m.70977 type:complete len:225 (+) Transcript_24613:494-1168(+)